MLLISVAYKKSVCGIIYSRLNSLISIFLYFHLFETHFSYLIAVAVLVLSSVVIVFIVALEVTIQYFPKCFLFCNYDYS